MTRLGTVANLNIRVGYMIKRGQIGLLLVLLSISRLGAQERELVPNRSAIPVAEPAQQASAQVYLEQCETLSFDEERHPDAQLLKGNVRFRHEDALLFCDSAYFYEKENSIDAFGHVRFLQGDTLTGYGDMLYYNGNTKLVRLRNHVHLTHKETTLTTDSLNYDRIQDLAYYFSGGTITDDLNQLSSVWGQYTPQNKQAIFKTDVVLEHPKFTLYADTLKYNTGSYIADLVGPTKIIYEQETTILSTSGWYNTQTEEGLLLERSQIIHNDGKFMTGDSLFYDKQAGFGKALHDIVMSDSVQQATLKGNYGEMYEEGNVGYVTDSALFIDWSNEDWLYLHADTLFTEEVPYTAYELVPKDSILVDSVLTAVAPDTLFKDTTYQQMRAYYGVRIYQIDTQAKCDSMVYNGRDSILVLFGEPVCWNEENQLSADSMKIYLRNGDVDYVHGIGNPLVVKQESETQFDQMAGKEMFAYVREGELKRVDVNGNAETVFYPREDDGTIVGVNKTQSSYVKIYLEEQKIDHIVFTTATTGATYPLDSIATENTRLGGFFWAEQERPLVPGEVFTRPPKTQRGTIVGLSAREEEPAQAPEEERPRQRDRKHKKTTQK